MTLVLPETIDFTFKGLDSRFGNDDDGNGSNYLQRKTSLSPGGQKCDFFLKKICFHHILLQYLTLLWAGGCTSGSECF